MNKLIILKDTNSSPQRNGFEVVKYSDIKKWIKNFSIFRCFFSYKEVIVYSYDINLIKRPFVWVLLARLLSKRYVYIEDEKGEKIKVTSVILGKFFWRFFIDYITFFIIIGKVKKDIATLIKSLPKDKKFDTSKCPLYIRSCFSFGLKSGGSIGHISGVLNNLEFFTNPPIFIGSDKIPLIKEDIEQIIFTPNNKFLNLSDIPIFYYNHHLFNSIQSYINEKEVSFIYQRYSLNNYTGVLLSHRFKIPFILEYNGSEIWVARNWGKRLKYETISMDIELLNLNAADIVVAVSKPIKDELVERGIQEDKVLINPNGVDPEKYSPDIDGTEIRKKYRLKDKTVIGFIGTFGPWHGAEVLVESFGMLIRNNPQYKTSLMLLMIGDGVKMPIIKESIAKYNITDNCILTGLVSQKKGALHLAACDILSSPHVPNPDGTPFFGSPTKLFEYMAMGKGIVASDLDQIGQILKHGKTAYMVKPGDQKDLVKGLKILVDNKKLRNELGTAAREEVVQHYTWREHTRKIIEKLNHCCLRNN